MGARVHVWGQRKSGAMGLMLQLVNETTLPDGGPVNYQITGKRGIDIGRAAHLDWTLPDPTRHISGRHCEIRYEDGGYWLHDVSTNGTFLNGSDQRMAAPHRLRTGDHFTVGHYVVAVTVEGEEAPGAGGSAAAASPPSYQELWTSQGEIAPPPIDPRQLKGARLDQPVYSDFLDWAADVPNPVPQAASAYAPPSAPSPYPAPPAPRSAPVPPAPAARPGPAYATPAGSDMDWATGPPSRVPAAPPPVPPMPTPRRPGAEARANVWDEEAATAPAPSPSARPEPAPSPASAPAAQAPAPAFAPAAQAPAPAFAPAAEAPAPPRLPSGASPNDLLREIARAAGLPEDALAQKDPGEAAQQIGAALRLVTENLMQLLAARVQAKRLARVQSHTVIQAVDNNPLKFSPSPAEALRVMFGSSNQGYLDAHRAIGQGFADLKAHQLKTYRAMQQAIGRLMTDLEPSAIERATDEGRGIGGLLASRKAKLWDTYESRWNAKIGAESGRVVEAFLRYFAEAYDRDGG
jgi:type VI secretion system protein ImpI